MLTPVYVHESWEKSGLSIFLAGPSSRSNRHYDWRPEALECLEGLGFDGAVFIPLPRDTGTDESFDYEAQTDWELNHLDQSSSIAFWIPRDLKNLPGFTTNVEYGIFLKSGEIVLGYPESAAKMKYLHKVATRYGVPIRNTLASTMRQAGELACQNIRNKAT